MSRMHENKARRQQGTDLAALVPLKDGDINRQEKEVVIDTFGNEIVESQPSISQGTDYGELLIYTFFSYKNFSSYT